jgi:coronin-1B/1C/6
VYGEKSKTSYENAKISGSAWDTDLVSAGGKYIAVNWQVAGGGVRLFLLYLHTMSQDDTSDRWRSLTQ